MIPINTVTLYGLPFVNESFDEVLQELETRLRSGEETLLFTPNGEILYRAKHTPDFHAILSRANLLIPDGVSVLKVARILGTPLKEKIAGIEVAEAVLQKIPCSVFLLGAKEGIAEKAAENLKARYPQVHIAGTHHGFFEKEGPENEAVLQEIRASEANVLFVCLGSPAQEVWIVQNKNELPGIKLWIGLGGSIDVFAGNVKRAPKLFLKLKLEWLYRLVRYPSRIPRTLCVLTLRREARKEAKKK